MYVLGYDDQRLMLIRKSDGAASVTYDPEFIALEQLFYVNSLR